MRGPADPGTVLFLCSGNYYRSRFAEHWFNWRASQQNLAWRAQSRGLRVDRTDNVGPISQYCVEGLRRRGVPINGDARFPLQLTETDLVGAAVVVAVKEAEHRAMLAALFPDWVERVEYWAIHDLDCAQPGDALAALEREVERLLARLG